MVRKTRSVNNYFTTLDGAINDTATTLDVDDVTGLPSEGDFYLGIDSGSNAEIVKVTHISTNTLSIIRAQAGTANVSHSNGVAIRSISTAQEWYDRMNELGARKCLPLGRITDTNGNILDSDDFDLQNTGTGTSKFTGAEGIIRLETKTHGSNNISGLTRNFDTTNDWRITAHLSCPGIEGTGLVSPTPEYYGLASRQSSSGGIYGIFHRPGSPVATGPNWGKVRVDNRADYDSSFSADATSDICGRRDMWMRLEVEWDTSGSDDDLRWYYSFDGVHFVLLHTHSFASEDLEVGFWLNNDGGPSGKRCILLSWHEEALTF